MKTANLAARSVRQSNVGLVWKQLLLAAATTQKVPQYSTLRVRAIAQCTITLDGVDSITLEAGEVEYINVGNGDPSVLRHVVVEFSASVNCSIAEEEDRKQ